MPRGRMFTFGRTKYRRFTSPRKVSRMLAIPRAVDVPTCSANPSMVGGVWPLAPTRQESLDSGSGVCRTPSTDELDCLATAVRSLVEHVWQPPPAAGT